MIQVSNVRRPAGVDQTIAGNRVPGGKSEHHRAGCSVTRSHGDVKESATESRPPTRFSPQETGPVRVKRCGKSAPVPRVTGEAWQTPPGARPNRGAFEGDPPKLPGRSQEVPGNRHPQMNDRCPAGVTRSGNRIRLTGCSDRYPFPARKGITIVYEKDRFSC